MSDDNALTKFIDNVSLAETVFSHGVGAVRLLKDALDPTPGFIAKRDQMDIQWWADVVNLVNDLACRMSRAEQEAFRQRLGDHEAVGILANYVVHAHQEPLDESRRMLEHGAASLTNMRLGVAELARVQRVLRELEPNHLLVLYRLWLAKGRVDTAPTLGNARARFQLQYWEASGAESLETAGCLRVEAKGGGAGAGTWEELRITRTGLLVLRALRSYIAASNLDRSTIPGHEVTADFRTETEAWAMIRAVPGLYEALLAARGIGFGPIQYDAISPARGLPANGKTKLITDVPTETAEALRRITTREKAEHGQPVSTVYVDLVSPSSIDGKVSIQIAGPHDVLCWLAYDLDAWWN